MRVLLLGHAGLEIEKFLNATKRLAEKNHQPLQILDLEKSTQSVLGRQSPFYIDLNFGSRADLLQARSEAFENCLKKTKTTTAVLHLHAVYRRRGVLFHALDWNQVRRFKPAMVVTLIDNVYEVSSRIKAHPMARRDRATREIRFKDIMEWRAAELMMGQSIADHCSTKTRKVKHYVVARRHHPSFLYELFFESVEAVGNKQGKQKVYASFPISKTFTNPIIRKEVHSFREQLSRLGRWIVFDPWTIDERILLAAANRAATRKRLPKTMTIEDQIGNKHTVDFGESIEIAAAIDAQIPYRDYQLIEPCDMLIAWRGGLSRGVRDEIQYANQLAMPTYSVWPSFDPDPSVFENIHLTDYWATLDGLFDDLK